MYKNVPEEKGTALQDVITGQGLFPCGTYLCKVSYIRDDEICLVEPAKGVHVEALLSPPPSWLVQDLEVEVVIILGKGVYARRNAKGELALYDSKTQERITPFSKNIIPHLKNKTLAQPTIAEIRAGENLWTISS